MLWRVRFLVSVVLLFGVLLSPFFHPPVSYYVVMKEQPVISGIERVQTLGEEFCREQHAEFLTELDDSLLGHPIVAPSYGEMESFDCVESKTHSRGLYDSFEPLTEEEYQNLQEMFDRLEEESSDG